MGCPSDVQLSENHAFPKREILNSEICLENGGRLLFARGTAHQLTHILFAMAPVKRKGNDRDESPASSQKKRVKTNSEKPKAQKNGKPDGASKKREDKQNTGSDSAAKPGVVSVLRDEAPAFPRGGANVLTPLERKQIQIQATRDVLFEQKGGPNDSDASDDDDGRDSKKTTNVPKPKRKKKKEKTRAGGEDSKEGVRIEPLNFKVYLFAKKLYQNVEHIANLRSALFQAPRFWDRFRPSALKRLPLRFPTI